MDLHHFKSSTNEAVLANYSKLSEHIRRLTPQGIQCSVFCGGVHCKYENPENWKADSLAIQGIYSHWMTDDILAMARPSTAVIIQKNIIQQFESLGIKTIVNLQSPNEHASCGQPLEESGFSYNPNIFMENNIYYYNFAWKDYGDATLVGLINMVKVLTFAISQGRVAIHCHAGLGRTGVLIACFLVYSLRVGANDAIRYVRLIRRGSVQTRGQIICVRHFAQFILPQTITYFLKENINKDKYMRKFTIARFLTRQRTFLHGYDERNFKYLPKIVHCICERILKICGCCIDEWEPSNVSFTADFLCNKLKGVLQRYESSYSLCCQNADYNISTTTSSCPSEAEDPSDSSSDLSISDDEETAEELLHKNPCFQELETQKTFAEQIETEGVAFQNIQTVVDSLLTDYSALSYQAKKKIRQYQFEINTHPSGWTKLMLENDLKILGTMLFQWIEGLKNAIIQREHFENIVVLYNQPEACFQTLPLENAMLVEYLLRFLGKIQPIDAQSQEDLLKRIIAACSQQSIIIRGKIMPSENCFKKLRDGTLNCTIQFFQSLFQLIESHPRRKNSITFE